jgi:hypothetical protein
MLVDKRKRLNSVPTRACDSGEEHILDKQSRDEVKEWKECGSGETEEGKLLDLLVAKKGV